MVTLNKTNATPSPEKAMAELRAHLDREPDIQGKDGLPIHWMVMDVAEGLLVCDSAYLLAKYNFSGIKFRIGTTSIMLQPEEMAPMFEIILGWLDANIPEGKNWAIEFKNGCPIIPVNREVIGV